MKTKLLLSVLFSFVFYLLSSQVPQGFNYQAIARDADNDVIANKVLQVRITLQTTLIGGTKIWEETHPVTTNEFGLMAFVIGSGTWTGGSATLFSDINWSLQPLFLKTEVDPGTGYVVMGTSQLWSVPYSMVAKDLDGPVEKLGVTGVTANMDEALFEVKNRTGQTVFAVYNEGVRVYVDNGAKGIKGGFAIGGFDKTKDGINQDFFIVNRDSVRFYLDTLSAKTKKGGFAIGGFNRTKGVGDEEYLRVTRDSTRIYINDTPAKGIKGGFAIGGFGNNKGPITPFTSLTPSNYFIGHKSGKSNTTGIYNSFLGYESGPFNKSGSSNALFGYQAGFNNIIGSNNLFLGYQSGYSNISGNYNTFIGYTAGYKNTSGDQNSFMGSFSGVNNTLGNNNTFSGFNAGYSNLNGHYNNFFGTNSGYSNTSGVNNTFIGPESGYLNTTGSYNTFLGYRAGYSNRANNNVFIGNDCGYSNTTGNVNVFIGYAAGKNNLTGSGNVYMGNGAGHYSNSGASNVFMGERAGYQNISGSDNVFIGYLAGMKGTNTWGNVCIGYKSGMELTVAYSNVFVGESTGRLTTWGEGNVFIGNQAGESNVTGSWNVHIGNGAGQFADADDNIFLGFGSGYKTTTGGANVFLGNQSGTNNLTGQDNVYIGNTAGYLSTTGTGNVFIGKAAGWNETGSNKLYIDNSNTTTPLIYGDFGLDLLTVNGNLSVSDTYFRISTNPGTGTTPTNYCYQGSAASTSKQYAFSVNDALWVTGPSWFDKVVDLNVSGSPALTVTGDEAIWYNGTYFSWGYGSTYNYFAKKIAIGANINSGYLLYVNGSAYSTGSWSTSDIKFKKDIENIQNPLSIIMNIRGVNYKWKSEEYADKNFPEGRHYGVIAQEIENILPDIVNETAEGEKAVAYNEIIPVLIEAMKEQQNQIETTYYENQQLRSEVQELKDKMNRMEAMFTNNGIK